MEKCEKVAIIIPTYNNEGTIESTIQSVCNQTYKNIEIIIINDGSTDETKEVCEKYAEIDNRIKIIHQENGGISNARNRGIKEAEARYICFVDGDDEIEKNYVEELLKSIIRNQAQLSICGIKIYERKETKVINKRNSVFSFANMSIEEWKILFGYWELVPMWNKLFDREIIEKNGLKCDEKLTCGEDEVFVYEYLQFCTKIAFLEKPLYNYYSFRSSTNIRYLAWNVKKTSFQIKKILMEKYCGEKEKEKNAYLSRLALKILRQRVLYSAKKSNTKDLLEVYEFFWPYIKEHVDEKDFFDSKDWDWFCDNKKLLVNKALNKLQKKEVMNLNVSILKKIKGVLGIK